VGNICVLRSWKGLDFFVDTAAAMADPFKFIIVGDGPQRQRLQDRIRTMKMEDRFVLTGHQEQVEHFFSALDIFFFTSYASEGVPQTLLQAISSGLPIVVCRNPSVLEALQQVNEFIAIDYGDLKAARRSISLLSQGLNEEERRILSNRRTTELKCGLEGMQDFLLAIYRKHGVLPVGTE
jgi:glycosyltransferase involved in cell wall biosynthesis